MRTQRLSANSERMLLTVLEESENAMMAYEKEVDPPSYPPEEMPVTRFRIHYPPCLSGVYDRTLPAASWEMGFVVKITRIVVRWRFSGSRFPQASSLGYISQNDQTMRSANTVGKTHLETLFTAIALSARSPPCVALVSAT